MAGAIFRRLPLVAGAHHAPFIGMGLAVFAHGFFAEQFLGGEFAAQADVIMNADGLIQALGPVRHHMLDQRPGADRLDVHTLVLVELRLCHGQGFSENCGPRLGAALLSPG